MSIVDPVVVTFNARRMRWYPTRGREAFYDDDRRMIEFDADYKAADWIIANVDPDFAKPEPKAGEQRRLL